TVATGFVVDDAIVVLENVTRHVEAGMGRLEAALRGAREVGFTVLSISISLVAVFIPILLMGGLVGRLFREFAMTLTAAVLVSLGFFPQQDTGQIAAGLQTDQSSSFEVTGQRLRRFVDIIGRDPGVQTEVAFAGSNAAGGFMFITLKPDSRRHGGAAAVVQRL